MPISKKQRKASRKASRDHRMSFKHRNSVRPKRASKDHRVNMREAMKAFMMALKQKGS